MRHAIIVCCVFSTFSCEYLKGKIVTLLGNSDKYKVEGDPNALQPKFMDADATREKIAIGLVQVASGLIQPVDMQFSPVEANVALIAEKAGMLKWLNLTTKESGVVKKFAVIADAEEGLLGIAFHPQFKTNAKIYLNYTVREKGEDASLVTECILSNAEKLSTAKILSERRLMRVVQPYPNHNAGQLAFGPDGMLYVGWGDGGFKDDPHGHGQNIKTALGSMLRVNVETNATETFAHGFRNPWRYSFDHKGRLIVADVGQDLYEEIDIVEQGGNYGWNIREAAHCFEPKENCKTENLRDPIYEYGRGDGQSITGGYVYTGTEIAALKNKYVFADFVSGRLWAIDLPEKSTDKVEKAYTLGRWPVLISSFARDGQGNLYALDFASGKVLRLTAR